MIKQYTVTDVTILFELLDGTHFKKEYKGSLEPVECYQGMGLVSRPGWYPQSGLARLTTELVSRKVARNDDEMIFVSAMRGYKLLSTESRIVEKELPDPPIPVPRPTPSVTQTEPDDDLLLGITVVVLMFVGIIATAVYKIIP